MRKKRVNIDKGIITRLINQSFATNLKANRIGFSVENPLENI